MSNALMKTLMYGKNLMAEASADIFYLYTAWKDVIHPDAYHPLIPIVGGISMVTGHDPENRSLQAVMFGEDWIHKCRKQGASTKTSLICLAANFDDSPGIAALALELAQVANKPRTAESIRIDLKTYAEIVDEVFLKDYAGVRTLMSDEWGVGIKEGFEIPPKRTRSTWREELGYDVLIHPETLEPCKGEDGSVLEFKGVEIGEGGKAFFKFTNRGTSKEILSREFFPAKAA
jgi:hypothetical protein